MLPYHSPTLIEAGLDEAGRGCLAGPVFAAAVILPKNYHHPLLNDSKQLSPSQRQLLKTHIQQHAISFAVQAIDVQTIDHINILQASIKAMHLCIQHLNPQPQLLLIDGNYFKPYSFIPHHCIVKGDTKYASIAAASILAKTYRDQHMHDLHLQHPQYNWHQNKGYATKNHIQNIQQYGPCQHHRKTFSFKNNYSS